MGERAFGRDRGAPGVTLNQQRVGEPESRYLTVGQDGKRTPVCLDRGLPAARALMRLTEEDVGEVSGSYVALLRHDGLEAPPHAAKMNARCEVFRGGFDHA